MFESIVLILAGCGAFLIGFKLLSENMEKHYPLGVYKDKYKEEK